MLLWSHAAFAELPKPRNKILIIHSYAPDYTWTANINQAIIDTFRTDSPSTLLRFEFMDSKRNFTPAYLSSLALLYANKYAHSQPDGIIATDNNALFFMRTYGADIFPGVPVVATGISNAKAPAQFSNIQSIIAETANHIKTLEQAIALRPNTRTIHVIASNTPSGKSILSEVREAVNMARPTVHVEFSQDMNIEELSWFARSRKPNEIIYLLPHFITHDENYFKQDSFEARLSKISTVPIIVSWSFQMDTGVLGGNVLSAYNLGRQSALTLTRILSGQNVIPLQRNASVHETIYDYNALRKYDIDMSKVPAEATFINRPESFFMQHFKAIVPAAGIILVLSLILFLTYKNLQKQLALQATQKRIINLDKEVIETQREIVSTLGEVIEARSHETGGHVKRVAKVSRFLGNKLGIDEDHLDLLEAASPMHDVGKIGIPESILHKPGKLTPEEFEQIKTHTSIGKEILNGSNRELLQIASDIAHQHHERWDGKGYPNGLKEKEISIYARITMVADVYDALSSKRCYKEAWPEEKVLSFIASERAKAFDPKLVDIFLSNVEAIRTIREQYIEQS
ncbi:MAG: HD domain-containing protein [Desulfovibrionales bacterium]|nr:HD domain-containing protein [Desulfovibrionales bacterium]